MSTPSAANILDKLYACAVGNMDQETIKWLADGANHTAQLMAQNLAETVQGIGCLVADDKTVGSFRGEDLPELLWGISNSIDTIQGLMLVGSRARDALDDPEAIKFQANAAKRRKGGAR